MADPREQLRAGLSGSLRARARARARRHGHGLSGPGPPARPPGRAQGAPPRAGRLARARPVPARDPLRRPAAASPHPHGARLRRGRRPALVHHAVRRGREPPRPAPARAPAPGRRRAPDRAGGGARARLRPPARHRPPRHQAREHPAHPRRLDAGGRLRDRPRPGASDDQLTQTGMVDRDAGLHEPGAGERGQGRSTRGPTSTRSPPCSTRCWPARRRTPGRRRRRSSPSG